LPDAIFEPLAGKPSDLPLGATLEQMEAEHIRVLLHYNKAFRHAVALAAAEYFEPAAHHLFFDKEREAILRWNAVYEWILDPIAIPGRRWSPLLAVGIATLFLFAAATVVRAWSERRMAHPADVTMLFILMAMLYLGATGMLLNLGENNRYRFVLDPLFVVLLGLLLSRVWHYIQTQVIQR